MKIMDDFLFWMEAITHAYQKLILLLWAKMNGTQRMALVRMYCIMTKGTSWAERKYVALAIVKLC